MRIEWLRVSSYYNIESFFLSDIGLLRTNNEDACRELSKEQFYILADGMGGHNAGEVASHRTVEYLCSAIQDLFIKNDHFFELEELESHLFSLIENTNLWIHHLSSSEPSLFGMGTTLCAALFFKKFVIYSHVGDSRIYRFREGALTRLTEDHTIRNDSHDSSMNQNSVMVSSNRKVLVRAIGTSIFVLPEIKKAEAKENDIYLLCSDGLTDLVSDVMIEEIISKNTSSLPLLAGILVEQAKALGGYDNITLMLLKVQEPSYETHFPG